MVVIGMTIFLIGAVFFELIIGISGFGLGAYAWSLLLIGLGLAAAAAVYRWLDA